MPDAGSGRRSDLIRYLAFLPTVRSMICVVNAIGRSHKPLSAIAKVRVHSLTSDVPCKLPSLTLRNALRNAGVSWRVLW